MTLISISEEFLIYAPALTTSAEMYEYDVNIAELFKPRRKLCLDKKGYLLIYISSFVCNINKNI